MATDARRALFRLVGTTRSNRQIAPVDLAHALGGHTLDALSSQTGMDRTVVTVGGTAVEPQYADYSAAKNSLPAIYPYRYFVADGVLILWCR